MIVAGIDPSLTSAGIAILIDGQPALLRSIGTPGTAGMGFAERSDRIGRQCRLVMQELDDWVAKYEPPGHGHVVGGVINLVVIEGEAFGANMPGGSERSGLWWRLYGTLRARRVPIGVVAPKTRALWATGDGNASKKAVMAAVKAWWPHAEAHITNDDIADAAAMALAGALRLGDPMPFPLKPQHYERIKAAQWPASLSCVKPETMQVGGLW